MAKDYLAMIADIEETGSTPYERNGKRGKSPLVTPASILATSRYGSLTRGGLRDALVFRASLTRDDALLIIDGYIESGIIIADKDGLYRVRQ